MRCDPLPVVVMLQLSAERGVEFDLPLTKPSAAESKRRSRAPKKHLAATSVRRRLNRRCFVDAYPGVILPTRDTPPEVGSGPVCGLVL